MGKIVGADGNNSNFCENSLPIQLNSPRICLPVTRRKVGVSVE